MDYKRIESIINDYIEKMKKDYNIIAAMLTGSYITGNMGPNSDIDIFFIWDREDESMRGREFYKDVEFEYFISPEWKYFDRLKGDLTSQQIYSTGKIVLDTNNIFNDIQQKSIAILKKYNPVFALSEKLDYSFYVETIMRDGMDMLGDDKLENFYFLSGMHIPRLCNIIAKIRKKYPIYEKYAMEELQQLDERLFLMIMELYKVKESHEIRNRWISLCEYILNELGDLDLKSYQVVTKLQRT